MVGANLKSLISSHNEPGLTVLLVLEESHVTSTTLLPLTRFLVELEQLGAPEQSLVSL